MKKTSILTLACLTAFVLLLSACASLTAPFSTETNDDTVARSPDTEKGSDTRGDETLPKETDIRTVYGTVVEYTAEEPMDNVVAVRVWVYNDG